MQFEIQGLAKLSGLWETGGMIKPELTDVGWLGPRDEMDRASHRFGKCSECHEIICVEKAVTDTQRGLAATKTLRLSSQPSAVSTQLELLSPLQSLQ